MTTFPLQTDKSDIPRRHFHHRHYHQYSKNPRTRTCKAKISHLIILLMRTILGYNLNTGSYFQTLCIVFFSNLMQYLTCNAKKRDQKFFAHFRRTEAIARRAALPVARASCFVLRARLAFASVRLKYAKKLRLLRRRETFNTMFEWFQYKGYNHEYKLYF